MSEAAAETVTTWWAQTQTTLADRGVPIGRGEIDGANLTVIGLDPSDALAVTPALLDAIAPQVGIWTAEPENDAYRIGLLGSGGWTVLECGTAALPARVRGASAWFDEDEDETEGDEEAERAELLQERAMAALVASAKAIAVEIKVGDPHDRDILEKLLRDRTREAAADDPDLVEGLEGLHSWDWSRTVDATLRSALREQHHEALYTDAETYAKHVRDQSPGIESCSLPVRRERVYQTLKKTEPCVTKPVARAVSDALNRIFTSPEPALFD